VLRRPAVLHTPAPVGTAGAEPRAAWTTLLPGASRTRTAGLPPRPRVRI